MNYSIRFKLPPDEDIVFSSAPGLSLLEASRQAGLDLEAPCSGNGTCGKCLVLINNQWRLACQTIIAGDLTALIPQGSRISKNGMKISGWEDGAVFDAIKNELMSPGLCSLEPLALNLKKPEIDDPKADWERLLQGLNEAWGSEFDISLYALRKLPKVLREGDFSCTCILTRSFPNPGFRLIDIFPGSGHALIPGLALDIGTTSVAAVLVNLQNGEILASGSCLNSQIRHGADVISRIIESSRPGGLELLRQVLLESSIIPLIQELAARAGIETTRIYRAALAANTTMTHLFAGVSPEFLRLEPYVPAFFHIGTLAASDLEFPIHPDAEVLIAPSVGSYVGGDISAGLFASRIFREKSYSLFIDLGTNGELVFGGSEFLMSCACSAGPAFEGGDISCGMRAALGAIDSIRMDGLEPSFTVIGGGKPLGICGSGLIDLVAELFEQGCIDPKGKFVEQKSPRLRRDEWGMANYVLAFAEETENGKDISLCEGDLDNFIRAKGAIFSGIRTMLAMLDLSINDIQNVYIAGGIGSGINIEKAIRIGMLPDIGAERYRYLGNTSLAGSYAMLISREAEREIYEIAESMTYLELSSHPSYMDEFIAACFLPHTDIEFKQFLQKK